MGREEIENLTQPTTNKLIFHMKYSNIHNEKFQYNNEIKAILIDCICHHQMILKFARIVEKTFHSFVLVKMMQITFLICFCSFLLSQV